MRTKRIGQRNWMADEIDRIKFRAGFQDLMRWRGENPGKTFSDYLEAS